MLTPQINKAEKLHEEEEFEPGTINKIHGLLEMDFNDEAERDNAVKKIKSQSLDEIADFILATLNEDPNRDELPQWFIDAVMDRYFQEFEKNPVLESNEYLHDEYLMELVVEKLISYHGNERINQPVNLTDKAFSSAVKYRIVHEDATRQYLEMLLSGGDLVRADILINGMADLSRNPRLNSSLLFKFAEHYAYHKKATNKGFEKLLDFENPENYSQTVKIIDFLKKLHKNSEHLDEARPYFSDWSPSKTAEDGVKDIIKQRLSGNDGSFLLRLHAEHYLSEMKQWEQANESKKRLKMFEDANDSTINLAPGVVGYYDRKDNILYVNRNDGENLEPIELSDLKLGNTVGEISDQDQQFLDDFVFMSRPDVREIIRQKIGITLSKIPLKEQANFLQLLISRKESEIGELKEFMTTYGDAGLRTFLSMEQGGREMGEKILGIGEALKNQPAIAEKLFTKYAELVNSADQLTTELANTYENMFGKWIDKKAVYSSILTRSSNFLYEAHKELKISTEENKDKIIQDLILSLSNQILAQKKSIDSFHELSKSLAAMIGDVDVDMKEFEKREREYWINSEKKEALDYYKSLGLYIPDNLSQDELISYLYNFHGDNPDVAWPETFDALEATDLIADYLNDPNVDQKEKDKFTAPIKWSSSRIIGQINHYKNWHSWKKFDSELRDQPIDFDEKEYFDGMGVDAKDINIEKEKIIEKFEKILKFQHNLENKLEQIIFGQQSSELPKKFSQSVELEIKNFEPELKADYEPIYMPVGISRLLPKEDEVSLKPIDSLAWLMWLNNQGAKTEVTVCDSIQTTNYQALYGLSPEEARAKALENGNRDKAFYQAAIDALNLSNVRVGNYQELENYSSTKDWAEKLKQLNAESPVFAKVFAQMIEGGVAESAGAENDHGKQELLKQYGQQEIAFIIANPALKISHEKEPRYDILARVIPVYLELKKHQEDLPEIKSEQDLIDLSLYLAYYKHDYLAHLRTELFAAKESTARSRQKVKTAKTDSERQTSKEAAQNLSLQASALEGQITKAAGQQEQKKIVDLLNKNIRQLGLGDSKIEELISKWQAVAGGVEQKDWYKKVKLPNFYYPQKISSLSFEMSTEQQKEAMGFREPYSTYRGEKTEELAIESNQVIASTNPLAAAKLLVLSEQKQAEYANKVLQPLLVNYYIATSSSREEALSRYQEDAKNLTTVSDVIRLVQDRIVRPVENNLAYQH